jgi:hypothetical protein
VTGKTRICRDCLQAFEQFTYRSGRCGPCLKAYKRAYQASKRLDPKWVERRRAQERLFYLRNKRVLDEILKGCRCKECREADPRTLRFYDVNGRMLPMSQKVRKGAIEQIKQFAKTCQVMCFNCRAKLPKSRIRTQMMAA